MHVLTRQGVAEAVRSATRRRATMDPPAPSPAYSAFPLGETSLKTFPVVPFGPTLSVVST
jgi:hypothetical protein